MNELCAVTDCGNPRRSLGLCQTHYKRHRRGRDLAAPIRIYGQGFDAFVDKSGECWIWTGSVDDGYGRYRVPGAAQRRAPVLAHRYAYIQEHGSIPDGLHLDHLCRNRTCVRPSHLEPVTCAENLRRARLARAAQGASA